MMKSYGRLFLLTLLPVLLTACGTPRSPNTAMDMESQFSSSANSEILPAGSPRMMTKNVMRNMTTEIAGIHNVNPDCSSDNIAAIKITQQPMHGAATIVQREGSPNLPASNPNSICNSRKVPGIAVDYTPEDGFHGSDLMTIKAAFHSGSETSVIQFLINVQ